jgi:hypothetical protein
MHIGDQFVPKRGKNYVTNSSTLKQWTPAKESIEELVDLASTKKQSSNGLVRVAYNMALKSLLKLSSHCLSLYI